MKTILQWVSLCAASLALVLLPACGLAQTIPSIQGTSLADPAVPVLIAPAPSGPGFFVLNQDFSLLQHSTVDASQNENCSTGPGIFSRTNPAARTLVTDLYNAYMSGPDGSASNTAVDAVTPEVTCTPITAFDYTGGVATQSVATNDPQHALYYLVSAFGGAQVDQLLVLSNLNNATVSSTSKFTELNEAALDTNGVYTSIVADTRSDFGLTAITELKTATSPGNLWIYYPQTNAVYKILGPGGVALPAVTSFIIPPQTDGGGSLLVLVNQDGLTTSNYLSPPQDTAPFTIIDLGQIRLLMGPNSAHNTITLPFVQQIKATTSFYAMLGAAYNPIDHRIYALVAGGSSIANIVENIISYDTLNPSAPGETVVADVSNITFSLGSYPQIALNAASGTMQILTSNPAMVYTAGITGTGNSAVALTGSAFSDSNFSPTYIAANPLQGETYIASASGKVDILTRPTTKQGGLTITLTGSDLGYTSQEYDLKPLALWPVYDSSLGTAKLTITVTPKGGTPVVLATGHVVDIGYPGSSFYTYTFPAAGQYTIVATADASANYPAVTSPPLNVFVGNKGVYPTAISLSVPATAPAVNGGATLNATVNLTGTTYAPLNAVYIQDQTGAEVGNVQLPKGTISNPITVPITINQGVQTLTATYAGDEQNQSSTSTPQVITVGTATKVTPTFAVTLPGTAVTGASVTGNLTLTSTSTTVPTGTVTIYATLAGGTTANQIATVPAAQAFASAGANFSFTAPAAGTYSVFAGWGGDTNYNNAISPHVSLVITGAPLQVTSIGIVAPTTATPGTAFNTVIGFNVLGAFTTQPTGNIVLTATSAGITTTIGTVTPAQGMAPGGANISVNLPNAGVYTLNANYAGDSLYAASSNTATVTVTGVPTTLQLTAGANQKSGTAFTANVALGLNGSTLTPTGNVVLTAVSGGGTPFTVATVTAAQASQSGGYPVQITPTAAGTYTITASYAGDAHFTSSTASTNVTVTAIATTVTLQAPSTAAPNVPFSAVVQFTPASSASTAPTGNIIITATPTGGTATVVSALVVSQASGTGGYTAQITLPGAGTYTLKAAYAGDSVYSSSSASQVVVVTPIATVTLRQTPALTVVNTPFKLCADVTTKITTATPTGSFALTGVDPNLQTHTYTSLAAAFSVAQNACSDLIQATIPGVWTFTVAYPGDSNFPPLTATLTVNFQIVPTSLSVAGAATATALTPYQVTVKLIATGADIEAGTIPITVTPNGSSTAAVTSMVFAHDASATNGTTNVFTFPSAGTYTVVASYPGDNTTQPSTSTPLVVVVGPPPPSNFTLTLDGPEGITSDKPLVNDPASNTAGLTLTTTGNGPGPVTLSITGTVSDGVFVFRDAVTKKLITTATPTAAGTKILLEYDNSAPSAALRMMDLRQHPLPFAFAGGLFGLAIFRIRKIRALHGRGLNLLCSILFVVCAAAVLAGCASHNSTIAVTATPVTPSTTAAPQSVVVYVSFSTS